MDHCARNLTLTVSSSSRLRHCVSQETLRGPIMGQCDLSIRPFCGPQYDTQYRCSSSKLLELFHVPLPRTLGLPEQQLSFTLPHFLELRLSQRFRDEVSKCPKPLIKFQPLHTPVSILSSPTNSLICSNMSFSNTRPEDGVSD